MVEPGCKTVLGKLNAIVLFHVNPWQDRHFIYLGWMITLSLALNGCPFAYFAPSLYQCIVADSLEEVTMPVSELPPNRRELVEKVHL